MRTEDGHIIRQCLNGESEAFGFLVDKYKGAIYAFAYAKLRNFHDAEDITQEVFIKAYRELRSLRRWDNFHAWIYAITTNLCKNWIRMKANRRDNEFAETKVSRIVAERSEKSYREQLAHESLCDLLNESLDSLPEGYRQVLTLFYLGDMSGDEIARFLGISPANVRKRLSRAKLRLKEEMVTMMSTTLEAQRLPATFTFRLVEMVKRVKINPMPKATGLPLGLSLAAGILIAVISLNPHLSMPTHIVPPTGAPLPTEMKVLKTGEIPVDIIKISDTFTISSLYRSDTNGESLPQNQPAFLLAPGTDGGTWTQEADMPTARFGLATSAVNGKVYAIGGNQGAWALEEYDPVKGKWTRKAEMPSQRSGFATSVVDGKIYAIGGSIRQIGQVPTRTVEEYDPKTDEWMSKADMPTARDILSASVVNGKIYVIGGSTAFLQIAAMSTVEEYDPATDTWTKKSDMPTARQSMSTCTIDSKIYVIGGIPKGNVNGTPTSMVEIYDPETDTWTTGADMPTARWGMATGVINGKIYTIGGSISGNIRQVPNVEEYDPVTDTWTRKNDMPTARYMFSASVVGDSIYAVGGLHTVAVPNLIRTALTTVEKYTPGDFQEARSVTPKAKMPTQWGAIKRDYKPTGEWSDMPDR